MQRAGDELLAGAAFAKDQDRGMRFRNHLDQLLEFAHARRFADDLLQTERFRRTGAELGIFGDQPVTLGASADRVQKLLGRKRFCQIINRTGFDRIRGKLWCRVRGDHEHRKIRPTLADATEELIARHAVQAAIRYRQQELFAALDKLQALFGAFNRPDLIALVPKHRLQRQAHILFVVDDEDWRQSSHVRSFIKVLVGIYNTKRVPFPSSDSTSTAPPYNSTLCFTMANPRPVPFSFVLK